MDTVPRPPCPSFVNKTRSKKTHISCILQSVAVCGRVGYMAHAGGRPTKYTEKISLEICNRIKEGQGLRRICKDVGIDIVTVFNWLDVHEEFFKQYAKARDVQADMMADDIISIADNADDSGKGRLQVDARKWVASKLKPKKYGDKLDLTSKGKVLPTPLLPSNLVQNVRSNDSSTETS